LNHILIHPEVAEAINDNRPVVALESAVITCGLPRESMPLPAGLEAPEWNATSPLNLETARAMERTVRINNAVPATVAIIEGTLRVGMDDEDLIRLASDQEAGKASTPDLAAAMVANATAGTTVSATLTACALTQSKIRCFATGGIGGVHRNWTSSPDISADLRALASTPVCVICAGAKNILDLPATLEALQMLGVPVVGYRTSAFPQFHCVGDDTLELTHCVDDAQAAARLCVLHWTVLHQTSAVMLANPVPVKFALDANEANAAVERAEEQAGRLGTSGAQRTPFLLSELSRLTNGRSLIANLALLINNASLAARVAVAMRDDQ
jgi:pseudouridine-5'-phosphate glycosidase